MADETDFHVWLEEQRLASVETAYAECETVANRIKARATSLLGWTIPLSTAVIAGSTKYPELRLQAAVGAIGFIVTGILCASVLYSTRWNFRGMLPESFDLVMSDLGETTQIAATRRLCRTIGAIAEANQANVSRDARRLRLAWTVLAATPLMAALAPLLFQLFQQLWRHVVHG